MQPQVSATHITRQELYELVWAEPMSKLAKRFDISDRGLAKICAKAEIPVPERGYWARLQAGQERGKTPLLAPTADTPQRVTIRPHTTRILHHLLSMAADGEKTSESKQLEAEQTADKQELQWRDDEKRYVVEAEQKKDEILLARLLQQARDHRAASEIREFVSRVAASNRAQQPEEFSAWRDWALKQADKLDPLRSERLFDRMVSNTELWIYSRAIVG